MIDTHCHILPMCDDGPTDWNQALEMAKEAVSEGITDVIATPHHGKGRYYNRADKIASMVDRMNTLLSAEKVPLAVWAGQEYHYSANARQGPDFQALQPLHSSGYVLIELPSKSTPRHWRDFVQALRNSGYHPVIAHPERHLPFVQEPGNMYEWIVAGAYFQLTAPSVNGLYGREARKAAFRMAHNGWIHLLASDAHDTDARPLRLQKAYETLDFMLGQPLVGLLQDNARRLLHGEMLQCSEMIVPAETRRGPIGFLRRNR